MGGWKLLLGEGRGTSWLSSGEDALKHKASTLTKSEWGITGGWGRSVLVQFLPPAAVTLMCWENLLKHTHVKTHTLSACQDLSCWDFTFTMTEFSCSGLKGVFGSSSVHWQGSRGELVQLVIKKVLVILSTHTVCKYTNYLLEGSNSLFACTSGQWSDIRCFRWF